jgi:hypothetical protein
MSILSRLRGATQGTGTRNSRAGGRRTTGKGMGGGTGGRATGRGTTGGGFSGFAGRKRATGRGGRAAPSSSGGLGQLIGSLTKRH